MKAREFALGLIMIILGSGCAGMTGQSSESPSFENLSLDIEKVEGITGENYSKINSTADYKVNLDNVINMSRSFFKNDGNLSKAPKSVKSLVVALNSSEEDMEFIEDNFNASINIDRYEARKLNSSNRTVLFGKNDNISFMVETKGRDGFFSSAKELYTNMAEDVERFRS
jgi:hypothetical protein